MKGLFIVVDGIDGSGKSDMVKRIHNYLFSRSKSYRILTTREPTNGTYGSRIREILVKEKKPGSSGKELMGLFLKDRREHLKKSIEPFLQNSNKNELNIVVCDRYYYSNMAFQGAQGFDVSLIIRNNMQFRKPDIAFILDVDASIALKRIESRKKEKFEAAGFLQKTRNNFLRLPELLEDNIKIVDSSRGLEEVFDEIKRELDKILMSLKAL